MRQIMEGASNIHGHAVGSVVWLFLSKYSWWPCKVVLTENELAVESFGDKAFYSPKKCKSKNMKAFNCEGARELVIATKKKLQNMPKTTELFNNAIQKAITYVQESEPDFTLDFDPLADISTLSVDSSFSSSTVARSSTNFNTPDHKLDDSSVYTTGTNSKTRKAHSAKSVPNSGKRKLRSVASTPCSDILTKKTRISGRKRDRSPDDKPAEKKTKKSSPEGFDPVKKCLFQENIQEDILVKLHKGESVCQNGHKHTTKTNGNAHCSELSEEKDSGMDSHQSVNEDHHSDCETVSSKNKVDPPEKGTLASNEDKMSTSYKSLKSTAASMKSASKSPVYQPEESKLDEPSLLYTSTPISKTTSKPTTSTAVSRDVKLLDSFIDSETTTTGCDDTSTMDSDEEDMKSLAGSESEDDELPDVNLSVRESVKIHELKPEDIVWIKYDRYPFWPAMVINVKRPRKSQKSKSVARVVFFGYNAEPIVCIPIRNFKKVALFGSKKTEEFLENGRSSSNSKEFNQAYEEACNLLSLRASKEIEGTATEQYKKIIERRPKDYTPLKPRVLPEMVQLPLDNDDDEEASSEASVNFYQQLEDSDDDESTVISDDEEENDPTGPYSWKNVLAVIQEIKPDIVGIAKGSIHSDLHNTFHHGTVKDKARMKNAYPEELKKWPNKKVNKLVNELLVIAKETLGGSQLYYVMNVLLPEATVRIISKIDNITIEDAANRV